MAQVRRARRRGYPVGVLLLAIDTSTSAITVAVHDGSQVVAEAARLDARGHAEHLAPQVAQVLAAAGRRAAEVTDVVVGLGPGPFTGLRVGIVTGRTLAFAVRARLHGHCSLEALAHEAGLAGLVEPGGSLLVATDARRREVYWARYEWTGGEPRLLDGPQVGRAAELPDPVRTLGAVGRGPLLYPDALVGIPGAPLDVSAAALAALAVRRLGAGADLGADEPLYLRRPDAAPLPPAAPATAAV